MKGRGETVGRAIGRVRGLTQLRAYVDQCYGDRLKHLILFSSQSRNEATPDSDIDVMLVLTGTENTYAEYDRISQFVADLCLEHEGLISCVLTLFGILKSRGFNLEDAHLKEMERLSKLVALLTLAMVWAIRVGEWLTVQTPIPIKNHGRKAKSIFRVGYDYIRDGMINFNIARQQLLQAIQFLSCT